MTMNSNAHHSMHISPVVGSASLMYEGQSKKLSSSKSGAR